MHQSYITTLIVCLVTSVAGFAQNLVPYRKGAAWGYSDRKGNLVIKPKYSYADFFTENRGLVGKEGRFGFIDRNGKVVIGLQYEAAFPFQQGVTVVQKKGKYAVIDTQGNILTDFAYTNFSFLKNGIKLQNEKGWGVFLPDEKRLIPPSFEDVGTFRAESALFWFKEGDKIGIALSATLEVVFKPQFDEIMPFHQGYAVVRAGKEYGIIDLNGEVVVPPAYDYIPSNFTFNRPLQRNGEWVVLDKSGEERSSTYTESSVFYNGFARVSQAGKYGFINQAGEEVIPIQYEAVGRPENGLIAAKQGGKWGFLNFSGGVAIDFQFEDFPNSMQEMFFMEGLSKVAQGGKYGYIDTLGNIIVPFDYEAVTPFYEPYALVKKNGKYGFINPLGKTIVPTLYTEAYHRGLHVYFEDDLALMAKGEKWGFVRINGEEITPFAYDPPADPMEVFDDAQLPGLTYSFYGGICKVSANGRLGFIDRNGKEVTPLQYDAATEFENGLAGVQLNGKWAFINRKGETVTPFKYEDVKLTQGFCLAKRNGRWGVIGSKGNELLPCKFEEPVSWDYTFKYNLMWVLSQGNEGYVSAEGFEFYEE